MASKLKAKHYLLLKKKVKYIFWGWQGWFPQNGILGDNSHVLQPQQVITEIVAGFLEKEQSRKWSKNL